MTERTPWRVRIYLEPQTKSERQIAEDTIYQTMNRSGVERILAVGCDGDGCDYLVEDVDKSAAVRLCERINAQSGYSAKMDQS